MSSFEQPFRIKKHQHMLTPEHRAQGNEALAAIREELNDDPMERVWPRLTATQRRGLFVVAGVTGSSFEDGQYHATWQSIVEADRQKILKTLSVFAGLAVRIKGAL